MQVLTSLAFCIMTGLALAGLVGVQVWFNQPGRHDGWKLTTQEVDRVKVGLIGGVVSAAAQCQGKGSLQGSSGRDAVALHVGSAWLLSP